MIQRGGGGKGGAIAPTATPTPSPTPTRATNMGYDPNEVLDPATQGVKNRKDALMAKYAQVSNGTLTIEQYNPELDTFLAASGITTTEVFHPNHLQTSTDCSSVDSSKLSYNTDGTCYDSTEGTRTGSTSVTAPQVANYPYAIKPRYAQRILWNLAQVPQYKGYYCGPAVAEELIRYWSTTLGKSTRSVLGDTLGQANLAWWCTTGAFGCDDMYGKYLQTEEYAETLWNYRVVEMVNNRLVFRYHYPMQRGVNRWRQNDEYGGDYLPVGPPVAKISKTTLHDNWITDIDAAFPLAFDLHENTFFVDQSGRKSGTLPGHPTDRPIHHWIAVRGYSTVNYYDQYEWVHYVDSAYGASGLPYYPGQPTKNFTLTQPNQRVRFDVVYDMMQSLGYGYVW
ncbi:MAG TPA: hypothetical protein VND68_00110 [Chloroflexia bacterium]|nr:hypothetical protein [Chloroflexia bacterium]